MYPKPEILYPELELSSRNPKLSSLKLKAHGRSFSTMNGSITTIVRAMFGDVDFQVPCALKETCNSAKCQLKETVITTKS